MRGRCFKCFRQGHSSRDCQYQNIMGTILAGKACYKCMAYRVNCCGNCQSCPMLQKRLRRLIFESWNKDHPSHTNTTLNEFSGFLSNMYDSPQSFEDMVAELVGSSITPGKRGTVVTTTMGSQHHVQKKVRSN